MKQQHVLLVFYSYLVLLPQAVAGLSTLSLKDWSNEIEWLQQTKTSVEERRES